MYNRRLEDQSLILRAISCVRKELIARVKRGHGDIHISKVLIRLSTLYSLLDVERLKDIVEEKDNRDQFERKKAA